MRVVRHGQFGRSPRDGFSEAIRELIDSDHREVAGTADDDTWRTPATSPSVATAGALVAATVPSIVYR
jgi:hypothetical protein